MGRDLFTDPYGRFYYLSSYLAKLGHKVDLVLLDYKASGVSVVDHGRLRIHTVSALSGMGLRYFNYVKQILQNNQLDWIGGFSDTYYGIFAVYLARKYKIKSLVDLYDNYEGYIPWLYPLHLLWRKALKQADVVIVAGKSLHKLVSSYRSRKGIHVISMAVDPKEWGEMDKSVCRHQLGLSQSRRLVGYCGSFYKNRGIRVLDTLAPRLKNKYENIEIVVSGKVGNGVKMPDSVNYMGFLDKKDMPLLMNSLDVLLVLNKESKFGLYSHPIKLYEAMKCRVPVVVSESPSTRWILRDHPELLVPVGDSELLEKKIVANLDRNRIDYGPQPSWQQNAEELEQILVS